MSAPMCRFCKNAGKTELNHFIKGKDSQVICPTLLANICTYCKQNGHTLKYCPALIAKESNILKKKEQKDSWRNTNNTTNNNTNINNTNNNNTNAVNKNPVNKFISNKFALLEEVIDQTIQVNVAVNLDKEIKRPVQFNIKINKPLPIRRFVEDNEEW